jgi:hypothetical protein
MHCHPEQGLAGFWGQTEAKDLLWRCLNCAMNLSYTTLAACRDESVTAALMREQMKTIACHPERSEGSAVEFSLFDRTPFHT